jgi:hypothetical protein
VQKGAALQILAEPRRRAGVASDGLRGNHRVRIVKADCGTAACLSSTI